MTCRWFRQLALGCWGSGPGSIPANASSFFLGKLIFFKNWRQRQVEDTRILHSKFREHSLWSGDKISRKKKKERKKTTKRRKLIYLNLLPSLREDTDDPSRLSVLMMNGGEEFSCNGLILVKFSCIGIILACKRAGPWWPCFPGSKLSSRCLHMHFREVTWSGAELFL